jgi:hypothetical protein
MASEEGLAACEDCWIAPKWPPLSDLLMIVAPEPVGNAVAYDRTCDRPGHERHEADGTGGHQSTERHEHERAREDHANDCKRLEQGGEESERPDGVGMSGAESDQAIEIP